MQNAQFGFNNYPRFMPPERPTTEQQSRIDKLTDDHLRLIDEAILANASLQWQKVARVIGSAMDSTVDSVPRVPDSFYAERIRQLVATGQLESEGNLDAMRSCEVRLPDKQK